MSYREDATRYREMIGRTLNDYMRNPYIPKRLLEAMDYSLNSGGKLMRPCLTLASCDMLGGEVEDALPVACALEMIHSYSLIHDDLPAMDNDDYRRGKLSNHKVFGEGMAVLAGDGLLSYAFEVMLAAMALHGDNPGYLEAVRTVSSGAGVCGMVAGQAVDLESEGEAGADETRLRYIHARKTGAIIKSAALAGAHIANADDKQLAAMSEFGSLYGLLFQITDDVLDVEGSFTGMGKTLGKDEATHKLTYVNLCGLETAKQMALETAQKAKDSLTIFGPSAQYFIELTDATLRRDH
ncbi:MAG: polyprenyl synthetase family protein [Clostridia bacterium]|nr:polyprenyl synthetase family protein [Clostridia bacterium]